MKNIKMNLLVMGCMTFFSSMLMASSSELASSSVDDAQKTLAGIQVLLSKEFNIADQIKSCVTFSALEDSLEDSASKDQALVPGNNLRTQKIMVAASRVACAFCEKHQIDQKYVPMTIKEMLVKSTIRSERQLSRNGNSSETWYDAFAFAVRKEGGLRVYVEMHNNKNGNQCSENFIVPSPRAEPIDESTKE